MIVSWVAVITLSIFAWVCSKEPILLEITKGKESDAKATLIWAAVFYFVIALLVTVYKSILGRGETMIEGVTRIKTDVMNKVLRAGDRHNTVRPTTNPNQTLESNDLKA
jgi:hypothetical protein